MPVVNDLPPANRVARPWNWRLLLEGLVIYYAGTLIVGCAVLFAHDLMMDVATSYQKNRKSKQDWTVLDRITLMDGQFYKRIASEGYQYGPAKYTNLVFFPAYPLLARSVTKATGASVQMSLVVISNIAGLASAALLASYMQARYPNAPRRFHQGALLSLAFVPAGFFFRIGYSEAVCLFLLVLFCLGMACGWRPAIVAIIAGAVSAVRPIGVSAMLPAMIYGWRTFAKREAIVTPGAEETSQGLLRRSPSPVARRGVTRRVAITLALLPMSCWGLLAFVAYQWWAFNEPLAFVTGQEKIHFRETDSQWEKAFSLATLEPIWSAYVAGSAGNWRNVPFRGFPPFDLQWMNPIYFVLAVVSLAYAARRKLLDLPTFMLGLLLLVIPYVTRAYELCMGSQGRFSLMVIPMYVALGDILGRVPFWLATLLVVGAAIMMFGHAAMFAAGYMII